jgi:hypothetical protein
MFMHPPWMHGTLCLPHVTVMTSHRHGGMTRSPRGDGQAAVGLHLLHAGHLVH